ncbi:hypothetical protein KI387_009727, partial [Taxus chinensis]
EFDWAAAVAEIDDACNRSVLAATLQEDTFPNGVPNSPYRTLKLNKNEVGKKLIKAVRQSTLDRFIEVSEKHSEGHQTDHPSSSTDCGNNDILYSTGGIKSDIDPVAAQTWIYPVNVPLRDYQFSIVKTALFSNTIVSLPTGLGKTLIAAVVMYNYYRWFPAGKIVFTAPSRPLVLQQIEACHNIVGIPQEWTIDMTGQMNPAQRSDCWQSKRVFFVTPQVLERDIQSGSCLVKQLVCLVVDEAHRAMGNYAYCVVVREIMAVPVQLRILALTATPGSKQATIQTVIDNLQISTLEYRNENDPDVRHYTHNKNIELITVAMDKVSINISNLLVEVITPVVQKLCSLGVFYSKDVSKLTPFEFLTARDKFRQSPPAFLAQTQYGEVESYFGVTITLYHIYKLLFSHGIGPAHEMLRQKLQQGSFARVMGRNETLWQAKAFMQQSIRHGAPNPKILKMKEIIIDHFQSKDLGNSRVIIFTNFRESVKDIMESLAMLGDAVKAMDFIGQSSGKASKGQSQKVQQAVLQKFRAGGYNTIVATSIGEEGLDIMEVDLVICFDANVSPLRMIQRMGRTGRKPSEGSELQGYLKKQAKGKALGKHMDNGGINSFSFHSSPRMVPHSYQPKVQFIEMSIEKFVPRGRKSRADATSTGPGADELSESEMNLLGKYFGSSTEGLWKPSIIAFPHYQLFPSRVYNVKHSFRSTEMLIDASQFLQEHKTPLMASNNFLPNNKVGTSSMERLEHVSDDTNKSELEGKRADITGPLDMIPEQFHFHPCSPAEPSEKVVTDSQGVLQEIDTSAGQFCEGEGSLGKHKSISSELPMHTTSVTGMRDKNSQGMFCEENDSSCHFYQGEELLSIQKSLSSEVLNTEFVSIQDKETMPNVSSFSKTSLHRCLFNTGFVSVSPDGRVIISSPPTLPLLNEILGCDPFVSGINSAEPLSRRAVSPPMKMGSPELIEIGINPICSTSKKASSELFKIASPSKDIMVIDSPKQINVSADSNLVNMIDSLEQVKISMTTSCQKKNNIYSGGPPETPPHSSKLFGIPEEVVLATPDSRYAKFPCDFKESILPPVYNACASDIDFSPYLTNLVERGVVPESPILAFSKDGHATTKYLHQTICNSVNEKSKSPAVGIVASSWEDPITYLREKGIIDCAINTVREVCKTPEGNKFAAHASPEILKSSKIKLKGLSRNVLHDNAEQLNFECLSISKSSAMRGHSTPLVNHKSNSCSEDWCQSSADAKAVEKPRKFKRLCKYKEHGAAQVSKPTSELHPKRNKKLDITNGGICRNSKYPKGKCNSEISVRAFIDEEADVSSDERVSTDEDDEIDSNEEASESDSFIDDRLELTAAPPTQAEGGQFDMMAVYRRSLFTQSQAEDLHRLARVYSGKEISDHSEMNASPDTYGGSHAIAVDNSSLPRLMQDTGFKTFSSSLAFQNAVEESLIADLDTSLSEKENSNIARKRKFSLQRVNPTEELKVLQNQVSSSVVRNLTEDFGMPTKQNEASEPIDRTCDDDLFEGLDLDALEVEAAKMARSRSDMNPGADKSCWSNPDTLDVGCSMKTGSFLKEATNIKEIKTTSVQLFDKHDCINNRGNMNDDSSTKVLKGKKVETANDNDMVFFCSPSFDLGI